MLRLPECGGGAGRALLRGPGGGGGTPRRIEPGSGVVSAVRGRGPPPRAADAYYYRGSLERRAGDLAAAIQSFERCSGGTDPADATLRGRHKVPAQLFDQLTDGLIWRSRAGNESQVAARERAVAALGDLQAGKALPHLIKLVTDRVRLDWQGLAAYDYSSVRLAALTALKQMMTLAHPYVEEHYPKLEGVISNWYAEDLDKLGERLHGGDPLEQTLAIFALGNIGSADAVGMLVDAFRHPEFLGEARWTLTDTLAHCDPQIVVRRTILPFLDKTIAYQEGLAEEVWKKRQHWYEKVAYLIGKIQPSHDLARLFLHDCIYKFSHVWVKARAIKALAGLGDTEYKSVFEQLAVGKTDGVKLSAKINAEDLLYLRRVAIEALGRIGDRQTIETLRADIPDWTPELSDSYYQASEEIYWRLSNMQ